MEIMRCESNVIMEWMNEIVLRQYKPMERMSGERLWSSKTEEMRG